MARVSIDGLGDVEMQLDRLLDRKMVRMIVEAGARAAVTEMSGEITRANHVRTGDMLRSVGMGKYKETLGNGEINVYPLDNDHNGVANAMKAYVINYGRPSGKRSKRMGDKFITGDFKRVEAIVKAAMEAESDRLIAEIDK